MNFTCCCLQSKLVMRAAAKLAPQQVLGSVGPLQQTCISLANTGNNAAAAAASGGSGVGWFRVDRFCIKEPLGHSLALILCTGRLCRQCHFRCCRRHWSHHCCQPPRECCLCDAHRMHYAGSLFGPLLLPASCRCGDCSLPAARWSLLLY